MPLELRRRERRGTFFYAIPIGTVVDGGTASATSFPDADPITNYTDWEFLEIEKGEPKAKIESEDIKVPLKTGGYGGEPDPKLTQLGWSYTAVSTNGILKMLENGLAEPAQPGVPQVLMGSTKNFVDCVCLEEIVGAEGFVLERRHFLGRITLDKGAGSEDSTSRTQFTATVRPCDLNTHETYES